MDQQIKRLSATKASKIWKDVHIITCINCIYTVGIIIDKSDGYICYKSKLQVISIKNNVATINSQISTNVLSYFLKNIGYLWNSFQPVSVAVYQNVFAQMPLVHEDPMWMPIDNTF